MTDREIYEFLGYRLNITEHLLEDREGNHIHLSDKAFGTLVILVRNAGHLVPKNELLEQIWAGSFVEENNLNKSIHAIRHALGETRDGPSSIETVRKHGFRFVADVKRVGGNGFEGSPTITSPKLTESGLHALLPLADWQAIEGSLRSPVDRPPLAGAAAETLPASDAHPSENAGWLRHPSIRWLAPLAILVVLGVAGLLGSRIWQASGPAGALPAQKRLTTGGGVTRVAMSPDGSTAAIVQNAAVKIFDVETGAERTLVPAETGIRILTIAFHPDGKTLYFGKRTIERTPVALYRMPLAGGEPTKVLDDIYGSLSFSPDGRKFAFLRQYAELNEFNVLTADADGTNISKLASSQMPNRFEGGPAWSPDGKTILVPCISVDGGFHFTIARIDSVTGDVSKLPDQRWTHLMNFAWLPDARRAMVTAQADGDLSPQIWRLDTATGAAVKVTNDSFVYESLSGSADGRSFVAAKVLQTSHIWVVNPSMDQTMRPTQVTSGFDKYDGVDGIAWSADGTIYYHSRASGRLAIWQMMPDGSGAKEITTDSGGGFAVSPDGRYMVFERQVGGYIGLRMLDLTTGAERPLAEKMMASHPTFTPDGQSVLFSLFDKKLSLWQIPAAGGDPKVISSEYQAARAPAVSPTGRLTAFAYSRALTAELQYGIAIMDNESKKVISMLPIKTGLGGNFEKPTIRWSADETEIYFILIDLPTSSSNLAKIRVADGTITKVTNFPDGRVYNFTIEPGSDRIALARGTVERDASIIKVERQ